MPDLHLTGVHEDGENLLVSGADGTTYRLILNDALRAAVRRGPAHESRRGPAQPLRPVDVQAMIRAGATADEAAERAGWPVEKVHRYEGPILAERAHVAGLAGGAHLRGRSGHIVTLLDRVHERLRQRGVEPDDADWDAWRSQDGQWTVDVSFSAGGRRRTASWHFSRSAMTVTPVDDESRWLGEDDTPAPAPARREVVARHDVYDVDSDPRDRRRVEPPDTDSEIMSSLRERAAARSGRRRTARRLPTGADPATKPAPAPHTAPIEPTPSRDVGFTTTSPTDVPIRTDPVPDDAMPLEPHGYDPDTMAAPPGAHAQPDVDGIDARPEPAAAAYAQRGAAPRTGAEGTSTARTAPQPDQPVAPTADPEPDADHDGRPGPEAFDDETTSPDGPASIPVPPTDARDAAPPAAEGPQHSVDGPVAPQALTTPTGSSEASPAGNAPEPGERATDAGGRAKAASPRARKATPRHRDRTSARTPKTDPARPPAIARESQNEQVRTPSDPTATSAGSGAGGPAPQRPGPDHAELPTETSLTETSITETPATETPTTETPTTQTPEPRKRPSKRGRASVPAWDDIMFGAKGPVE